MESRTPERPLVANDRRRRTRLSGPAVGWVLPLHHNLARHVPGDEEAWEVRIDNVSKLGVGFISTLPMSVGEEHRLRIGLGPARRARSVRVVVCRRSSDGAYAVGAEFTDLAPRSFAKAS